MTHYRLASFGLLGFMLLSACATSGEANENRNGVAFEKGAIILTGMALTDGSGSVLATMSGKVPNFRVQRGSGQCPAITLRSRVSFRGVANPHVYVDGTRSTDTCILESLRADDVERVEVYPQGFTTRPGYATHAPGLILVFLRT
jgi:hypothetical protein